MDELDKLRLSLYSMQDNLYTKRDGWIKQEKEHEKTVRMFFNNEDMLEDMMLSDETKDKIIVERASLIDDIEDITKKIIYELYDKHFEVCIPEISQKILQVNSQIEYQVLVGTMNEEIDFECVSLNTLENMLIDLKKVKEEIENVKKINKCTYGEYLDNVIKVIGKGAKIIYGRNE